MIPVASVVTKKSLSEFLLLKLSLEQYHEVEWYLSTDSYSSSSLSHFNNVKCQVLVKADDCSHGTNDPVKNRLFLELVMTKFDAMKAAISDHGYGLFIDSDIFFTAPIEDRVLELMKNPGVDAVLSPHMTNNLGLESQVGHFNVGFFSMRNKDYLKLHEEMSWRHKELGMYYEQQPLQFSSYNFLTTNLPIYYNVGWWRFNENHSKSRLNFLVEDGKDIYFDGKKVVCFHVHALKKLDYTNYGKFFMDRIVALMKNCDNKNYRELLQYIESNSENFDKDK
jgi:hypothetical protein